MRKLFINYWKKAVSHTNFIRSVTLYRREKESGFEAYKRMNLEDGNC